MEVATATKQAFPSEMAFQRTWRSYQARLLERLDSYLGDKRLHIVAAPGSGKTVLGLEVIRRIDQPTLVLAPTITIRNQWADRLIEHFVPEHSSAPAWLSTDIRRPAALTVATYQALHALCTDELDQLDERQAAEDNDNDAEPGDDETDGKTTGVTVQLPPILSQFKTLVVDEAHHLRAEWWRTLTFVAQRLSPAVVALTATPPYDVSAYEWQRYEELCGPVDVEVTVPELVLHKDLCPHQDYVYFSVPSESEQNTLDAFRAGVDGFVARLRTNVDFLTAVAAHPWMGKPDLYVEQILDRPEYMSSMVIYLNDAGHNVPPEVLKTLGIARKRIPPTTLDWLEILLTNCLYSDAENFTGIEPVMKTLRRELLQIGAIERRKVVLQTPSDHTKLLTTSTTKLHSIEEIVRLEARGQGDALRCVVLTDFIRKTELPAGPGDVATFEDIGVVPIFETLRRADLPSMRLGVLCGSLVIVPDCCKAIFQRAAAAIGIEPDEVVARPLDHDPRYLSVTINGRHRDGIVRLVTSVFEQGGITVLVGTKSLLGEGWDAPTINTLILASFVGSYVLSNQMRGRSIRVAPSCPSKTANVWHLVCVEPGPPGPGNDYELLARRCEAFVGVSATEASIANGVERLGLGRPPYTRDQVTALNVQTCIRALDRAGLQRSWEEALAAGTFKEMTNGLKAQQRALPGGFILRNTIAALLMQAAFVFVSVLSQLMRNSARVEDKDALSVLVAFAAVAAVASLRWVLPAVWLFIRHGTPERSIRQIGTAVLESLKRAGAVTEGATFDVRADSNRDGSVTCWITGGTWRDQTLFLRALREILTPVDNPRYLLARKRLLALFREDYFAVPEVLAKKKELAEVFAQQWRSRAGRVDLVYTRTPQGRKVLLRARMHSLAAAFQKSPERVSCWK